MPKRDLPKRTFGNGEIAPDFLMRRDAKIYEDGAKRMRNVRAIDSGSFERRPGSSWLATLAGDGILIPFYFNNDQIYVLHFRDGAMDAYLPNGTAAGGVSSAPWTAAMLPELRWHKEDDVVFLTHRDMKTQMLRRTGPTTWALSDYSFDSSIGNGIDQPYYKLADSDMTLQPSAATGTGITLTTSADFFVAGHVGTRVRWLDREIEITAVTNATTATGNVIQTLPPTQTLTVASTVPFQVGHVVEHDPNGTKGQVISIGSGTINVVVTTGTTAFPASGTLISPDGKATISGASTISPAAIKDWDEQLCSDVNGYFGVIAIHRGRMVFADHKGLPDALCLSKVGLYFNFNLGSAADSDAIFEFVGDGRVNRVLDMVSAETLVIYTDFGTYYVPERNDPPFTPKAFSIRVIDTVQAGPARAFRFERNIFCPDESGRRVYQLFPTGDESGPWQSRNAALLSPHLIRNPVSTAQAERLLDYPERYSFFVNSDGTMAVLHAIEDQEVMGITLWETEGKYKSVAAAGGYVFTIVERVIDGNTVYALESFDRDIRLDAVKEIDDLDGVAIDYANHTAFVTGSTYSYGEVDVGADGGIAIDTGFEGPFQIGLFFSPDVELLPPEITGDGLATVAATRKRITKGYVHTLDTGRFLVNGIANSAYRGGDNLTEPPPMRSEIRRVSFLGRRREPTIRITQEDAVPLKVIGVTMEVAY